MKNMTFCALLIILLGCSSNKINPLQNDLVYMSTDKAPADCKFVGKITNLHETYTSDNFKLGKNLAQAHIQAAKKLGANYVTMNADKTGDAYYCPNAELIKMNKYDWNN